MASAYATLAASGIYHAPHFVQKVVNSQGQVLFDASTQDNTGEQRIDKAVADNVTSAMQPIAGYSNGHNLAGGRPSAAKTGTMQLGDTDDNRDAWMVGFTPSLSTAVWVGTTEGTKPLENKWGSPIYGSGLPSDIWKSTMDGALEDTDNESFPKPTEIGGYAGVPQAPPPPPSPTAPPPPSETVIQPTIEVAPGITIPFGPPTTVPSPRAAARAASRPAGGPIPASAAASRPTARRLGCSDAVRGAPAGRPAYRVAPAAGRGSAQRRRSRPAQPHRCDRRGALAGDRRAGGPARADRPGAVPDSAAGDADHRAGLSGVGLLHQGRVPADHGSGTADQRVANWENQRAYYELCYSDIVPLYTAELLNLGKFPYKSSWIENDSEGQPRIQYDGNVAVRYMEYPVLTGIYQYVSMALAKTYTALSKVASVPVIAEVVMFFNIAAFGLALAWLATVWATSRLAGSRRIWDAALVAASPLVIFQIFTNFDALATACAIGALLAWARRRPVLAGALIGLGVAAKLYPLLLLAPLVILGLRTGRLREVGRTTIAAVVTWLVVNLPVMVLFPRGWSEFFRLNTRRGDDMDSLYNVVKSFTDWRGFDPNLGFWQPPTVLNTVSAILFVSCCIAIAYIALTAKQRPRVAQVAFLVVAAFLLTNKVWSPQFSLWLVPLAVLALPHRRILLAWMTIDALVWVPRMLYLYGEQNRGLPEQWFTATVLLRDIAVIALCALVIRQIYRPDLDLVRSRGRVDDPAGGVFDRAPDDAAGLAARLAAPGGGPGPGDAGARTGRPEPESEPDFGAHQVQRRTADVGRDSTVRAVHRAGRDRPLRSAATDSDDRCGIRRASARRGPQRQRNARDDGRQIVRRSHPARCRGVPGRHRHPRADQRRRGAGLGARGPQPFPVHHLGVHRRAGARRGRAAHRTDRDHALARRRSCSTRWVRSTCRSGWSSTCPERIITAAGVSSGIDMALRLVELLVGRDAAQASQLMIEYDPQPPFDAGDLAKASAETKELALGVLPAPVLIASAPSVRPRRNSAHLSSSRDLRTERTLDARYERISQLSPSCCSLGRLPTQATLLPRNDRGRSRP